MGEERSIIHLNVANFAVQVERLTTPQLRERPLIIATRGGARSVVYDMSQEAYLEGVRKRMPLRAARVLCPDAVVLPPGTDRYERAVQELWKLALPYSPRVEIPDRDGHLFIDTTGTGMLFGPPEDVARRLRREIKTRSGLHPVWAVAPNKLTAKVATRVVKPAGEMILKHGEEESFLAPLPVDLLPGIEPEDLTRLKREFRLKQIGDLAAWTLPQLQVVFGNRATHLYRAARGVDSSPVAMVGQEPTEVNASHLFAKDTNYWFLLENTLYELTERVGRKLREQGLMAGKMVVTGYFSDGARVSRQKKTPRPTAMDQILYGAAHRALIGAGYGRRGRVRRLDLSAGLLTYPPAQLELFPLEVGADPHESGAGTGGTLTTYRNLNAAIDGIRAKFGKKAIQTGRTINLMNQAC